VDLRSVREALRLARERAACERQGRPRIGMTLDDAEAASGVNRATIHSIENVKREPSLVPQLDTIDRLVTAYGLTLSSFFAQIEDLNESGAAVDNAVPPHRPGSANEPLPAPTQDDLWSAIHILARQAARADEADHRLSPDDAGRPTVAPARRARPVQRAAPRTKTRRSGKRP
jgi:transcriptional regulator with XRE-family HTH domain